MIKTKLISARKKLYTQEKMANLLHMSQSQYHRREKGDVKISDEEWERIAKVLDTTVEDIKEDDSLMHQVNNYDNNSGNYFGSNNYFILYFTFNFSNIC